VPEKLVVRKKQPKKQKPAKGQKSNKTMLSENMQIKANASFAIKLVLAVGSGVFFWAELTNRMSSMEMQMGKVQHESTMLGDLAGRVMHLEKYAEQAKGDVEHLMSLQDAPITSDFQQFERIKYLEKELDRLRDKMENHLTK
jgi:uncharacterized protein HemX